MAVGSWIKQAVGMGLTLENLEDLLVHQLEDLYSAEEQLISALPKMSQAASSSELKQAFDQHLGETKRQKDRLDQAFRLLNCEPESHTCAAMEGLVEEGSEVIGAKGDPDVKDAALIAAAQRVEHYEIAAYGCARTFAQRLGRNDVANLLQQSLDEEGNADKILTDIAESWVNQEAAHT
jgi:ferritin-like metal-binding protein YciE